MHIVPDASKESLQNFIKEHIETPGVMYKWFDTLLLGFGLPCFRNFLMRHFAKSKSSFSFIFHPFSLRLYHCSRGNLSGNDRAENYLIKVDV
jgi:hypothetical protein